LPEEFELDRIMRMVSAVPSPDERLEFIDQAAAFVAEDQLQAQPKGELAHIEEKFLESISNPATHQHLSNRMVIEPLAPLTAETVLPIPQPDEQKQVPETFEAEPAQSAGSVGDDLYPKAGNTTRRYAEAEFVEPAYTSMGEQEAGELARSLLDMMASSSGGGQPHERALAADTLLRLVPSLPVKPLILLADRLSIMEAPPPMLIAKLIRDPRIEVSGPLLENSPHVADNDLLQVIDEGTADQRRLVARRRKLTRMIAARLIQTMEPAVLLTLVRNANAEISHEGFAALTSYAGNDRDIMAPLCTRHDLPAPFAFELFWLAPVQLRRYILSRFLTDSETLTKILKITMATQGSDGAADKGFPPADLVERAIRHFAAGETIEADELLSDLMGVEPPTVARILSDSLGEPAVILLKAAGSTRNDFAAHLETMRHSDFATISVDRNSDELTALFDSMSFNKARILLTYWDWATRKSGPYAPIH
jgi:hypothetical protein